MSLDALPNELKLNIAENLEVIDFFRLVRTSRAWNTFVNSNAERLPQFECTNLRIEEFPYKRFHFKASAIIIREQKRTDFKNFIFRTVDDLKLFLRMTYVEKNMTLALRSSVPFHDELNRAGRDVVELNFRLLNQDGVGGKPLSIPYLASICRSFPSMAALSVEDFSKSLDSDATELIKAINKPKFLEFRSSVQESRLKLYDETLEYLAQVGHPIDVIVLSTHGACFTKEAVRKFLEKMDLSTHMYFELNRVTCTSGEFYTMLQQDLNVNFASEPMRGTFNSFHLLYKGQPVYVNIKFFEDSSGFNPVEMPRIGNLSALES